MDSEFHLLIEYLILPSIFMLVPRLNQFISDRLNGLKSGFFEQKWDWKLELSVVYFLSYIVLVFRMYCEGTRLPLFAELFVPLFEIALLIVYYVRLTIPSNHDTKYSLSLCFLFGTIVLLTIMFHGISQHEFAIVSNKILWYFRILYYNDVLVICFIILLFIVGFIFILGSIRYKKRSKEKLQYEFLDLQNNQGIQLEQVMNKFENYELKYGKENQANINYWMQKISYLVKNKYTLTAVNEIAKLKQSKIFASAPVHMKDAIIRFELELLLKAKEYWKATHVVNELSDLKLQQIYLKLIPAI